MRKSVPAADLLDAPQALSTRRGSHLRRTAENQGGHRVDDRLRSRGPALRAHKRAHGDQRRASAELVLEPPGREGGWGTRRLRFVADADAWVVGDDVRRSPHLGLAALCEGPRRVHREPGRYRPRMRFRGVRRHLLFFDQYWLGDTTAGGPLRNRNGDARLRLISSARPAERAWQTADACRTLANSDHLTF